MGLFGGGGLGGVGWCAFKEKVTGAFKDKVTGAFKEKVTGAFKHRVIFDFLCLRYVWYYIYKILGSPTRLSIRGGVKTKPLPLTKSLKSCRTLYAYSLHLSSDKVKKSVSL